MQLIIFDIDNNGNGLIDNQSELFGTAKDGAYQELIEYDGNNDGELKTMRQLKMTEIDLNYNTVDQIRNGNQVTGVGNFTRWVRDTGGRIMETVSKVVEAIFHFI